MNLTSSQLYQEALQVIPGGVNSPVRACGSVEATPPFIQGGQGARIVDAEGQEFVDYVMSWGPLILGHAHPAVVEAVVQAARRGTSFGAPTAAEVAMARLLVEAFPSMDMVRLVNSGTEAVMSAIRLARGFTNRNKILKFAGCYHGHGDSLLVQAGSGVATLGIPGTPGIPPALAKLTITVPFNDAAAVRKAVRRHGKDLACAVVEPVAANMGVVPPAPGFLETLREETCAAGALLLFDEVITGFRLDYGGFQTSHGIVPDLTCLGKIIGGGLPVGAFGGKREIMERLAPAGPVYQAGTLSGNPLAMAAGIATLQLLRDHRENYPILDKRTALLCAKIEEIFRRRKRPIQINQVGSLFTLFFTSQPVTDFATASQSDAGAYARFWRGMLARGIYLAPSPFEAAFVSFTHRDPDLEATLEACEDVLQEMGGA